jgi:hypothetical protein
MKFTNAISWFEIPATDINRAQQFYEAIFDMKMDAVDHEGYQMRMFPLDDPMSGVGGAICKQSEFHIPNAESGTLIYLNANPDVQIIVDRIEQAGGTIILPKTEISPEYGYMAVFLDTEGSRIALHSVPEKYL